MVCYRYQLLIDFLFTAHSTHRKHVYRIAYHCAITHTQTRSVWNSLNEYIINSALRYGLCVVLRIVLYRRRTLRSHVKCLQLQTGFCIIRGKVVCMRRLAHPHISRCEWPQWMIFRRARWRDTNVPAVRGLCISFNYYFELNAPFCDTLSHAANGLACWNYIYYIYIYIMQF